MILLTFNISFPDNFYSKNGNTINNELISSIDKKLKTINNLLEIHGFLATFFIEVSLIEPLQKAIKSTVSLGHELAIYNVNSDKNLIENAN